MHLDLQCQAFQSPEALCAAAHSWASAQVPPDKAATAGSVPQGTPHPHPSGLVYEQPCDEQLCDEHPANVQRVAHVQPSTPAQLEKVHPMTGRAAHICGVNSNSSSSSSSSGGSGGSRSHVALSTQPRSAACHVTHKGIPSADDVDGWTEDLLFYESEGEARAMVGAQTDEWL